MYSASAAGTNISSDFVMIIASMCGVNLEEVVVKKGSEEEKALLKRNVAGTYPILEVENTLISDSHAIAAYICKSSGNERLLGSNEFEQSECDQWMDLLR